MPVKKKAPSRRSGNAASASKKTTAKSVTKRPVAAKAKKSAAKRTSSASTPSTSKSSRVKLGRSGIPVTAPLDTIFEDDKVARDAFEYLGITTVRELQKFGADELIVLLTSPTKQLVGRIRRTLAESNRSLSGDEKFAIDIQKRAARK